VRRLAHESTDFGGELEQIQSFLGMDRYPVVIELANCNEYSR
jgi:hypothetical protein